MRTLKSHPLLKMVNSYVIDSPQPSNINFFWKFGSLLALCLIIQIIIGIALGMYYTPNVLEVSDSVEHIMRDVNNEWLIKYLQYSTSFIIFMFILWTDSRIRPTIRLPIERVFYVINGSTIGNKKLPNLMFVDNIFGYIAPRGFVLGFLACLLGKSLDCTILNSDFLLACTWFKIIDVYLSFIYVCRDCIIQGTESISILIVYLFLNRCVVALNCLTFFYRLIGKCGRRLMYILVYFYNGQTADSSRDQKYEYFCNRYKLFSWLNIMFYNIRCTEYTNFPDETDMGDIKKLGRMVIAYLIFICFLQFTFELCSFNYYPYTNNNSIILMNPITSNSSGPGFGSGFGSGFDSGSGPGPNPSGGENNFHSANLGSNSDNRKTSSSSLNPMVSKFMNWSLPPKESVPFPHPVGMNIQLNNREFVSPSYSEPVNLPPISSITQSLSEVNHISHNLPGINSITHSLPITDSIAHNLAITNSITHNLPITNSITHNIPITSSITQGPPAISSRCSFQPKPWVEAKSSFYETIWADSQSITCSPNNGGSEPSFYRTRWADPASINNPPNVRISVDEWYKLKSPNYYLITGKSGQSMNDDNYVAVIGDKSSLAFNSLRNWDRNELSGGSYLYIESYISRELVYVYKLPESPNIIRVILKKCSWGIMLPDFSKPQGSGELTFLSTLRHDAPVESFVKTVAPQFDFRKVRNID